MKKTIFSTLLALGFMGSLSAQLKVGVAGSNPNASAILELESTSKGFLPPRMTDAQRNTILSPPAGLLIYNTTSNALEVCDGTNWVNLATEGTTVRTGGTPSGNGGAGLGNASPVAQAKLQLSSTSKGFLPPRLTSAQRDAIASPPAGLLIYNSTDKRLEYANGSHWVNALDGSNITTINSAAAPTGTGDMGIGTTNPHVHASLEIESTTQGFLLPTMTNAQMESISNPEEGLIIYNTQTSQIEFFNGSEWVSRVISSGACAGSPSTIFHDGYVYKPVVSNGKCWLNNNLGASYANPNHPDFNPSQQATSSSDNKAYGHLFQWGRAADGHELINRNVDDPHTTSGSTTTSATTAVPNAGNPWDGSFIRKASSPYDWLTSQDNTLWQGVNGTNNPCPSGYRIPTKAEWDQELGFWTPSNNTGAHNSALRLTRGGFRYNNATSHVGFRGLYWSSTINTAVTSMNSWLLENNDNSVLTNIWHREAGFSVRCIKD